jgi:hypothetical protein
VRGAVSNAIEPSLFTGLKSAIVYLLRSEVLMLMNFLAVDWYHIYTYLLKGYGPQNST